ncbi:hypothetical protein, partial [Streptococcus pneumoniae]|uniref:hypothetical protein n=1 Tax=Streptococcus pneumoniae TaxID=1313 RepID=UPI0018B0D038
PWTALLNAPATQPGKPLRKPPSVSRSADGFTAKPAAALVLTDSGIADRPHVRLVPIVAIEFTATPPGALGGN